MLTESPPRTAALREKFLQSERLKTLLLPQDERLRAAAQAIESAMQDGATAPVRQACAEFLSQASRFYEVPPPAIRVLAARPLRVREGWTTELFGDYDPQTLVIRLWLRTAIRKQVTSSGTFLNTLCHEFCHHLDYHRFGLPDSWHTRGFYERTATLYHLARGTPRKPLFWVRLPGERWRIDWFRTKRGA